ncbi:cysteine desulfurase family protein [Salinarimonas ramus]|uniref:Cysteine desulfurase n=1 Tax=Salinarimonas ramus TaxID=690164 RepID=A0A917Q3V0_9HYPH|nr:cysteine desulfurase family protein [Salinarimonas ramus]GGK21598.1 cysteine desulfurase [Salinarimonas ramus]
MRERLYLDWNATAPLRDEAARALVEALARTGNASSVHAEGRAARAALEEARAEVAALVEAPAAAVVFTSGGSEANNLVLAPGFRRAGGERAELLLVGAGEHPCVLDGHRFPAEAVERIPLDSRGVADLAWLEARLSAHGGRPALVSLQLANNETGVIQPVAEAARIARAHGALIHTDAVQAPGKTAVSIRDLGVDAMTLSAHKIGGPQGAGALVLASEGYALDRLVRGGGQERGHRAGTENVPALVAFGAAARAARENAEVETAHLARLGDAFAAAIREKAPGAVIFGEGAPRLAGTVLFAVPGLRAETALIAFDLAGVALSSGSACSSGKVKRSHVLDAMGIEPVLAEGAIRLSCGHATREDAVIHFASVLEDLEERRARRARAA